jgi:hypothetical protein
VNRRIALLALAACVATASACSALVTFDNLASSGGGGDASPTKDAAAAADGAVNATDGATVDGASFSDGAIGDGAGAADASGAITSCNAPGLVAYWPMNEGSGTVVHDCAHGLDGAFGSPVVAWGTRNGKGSIEISQAGFVSFGTQPALQLAGAISVAGFIRSDALPVSYSSLFWDFANGKGYEVTQSFKGDLYGQVGTGITNQVVQFPMITLGTWHHLAFVFTPGVQLEAFLDGKSAGVTPSTIATVAASTGIQTFGATEGSSWTGAISDLRIFSRVLTQDEITVLASQ